MLDIRPFTSLDIENDAVFAALVREYGDECSAAGMPPFIDKFQHYKALENTGVFVALGAHKDGKLIGFVTVLTPVIPHYGVSIAVAESLFVAKEYRDTGAGLMLIRAAERHAKNAKCPGILFSAPVEGALSKVLPRIEYKNTSLTFYKAFA